MKKIIILMLLLLIGSWYGVNSAQALQVVVKRAIFEGSKRAEVITVINDTDEEVTYRVGWANYSMMPDMSLKVIPDEELSQFPEIKPVADMVRYAPRRFVLPPDESQQIRMILRMPAEVADGEYRSHLWIRPEQEVEVLKFQKELERSGKADGVNVKMLTGVALPVIVRKGKLTADVSITDFKAKKNADLIKVSLSVHREGSRSVYGDFIFTCDGPGAGYQIYKSKGVGIYAEVALRKFEVSFPPLEGKPACQALSVNYIEADTLGGSAIARLAEAKTKVE